MTSLLIYITLMRRGSHPPQKKRKLQFPRLVLNENKSKDDEKYLISR
jgi:hypothetical protein